MNKFKKSIFNSVTSLISILINSVFAIILGRIVIQYLGSDYNGVNATVTQILTILTLVEGGFTTASIVSLFRPFMDNDYNKINDILSTTVKTFRRISITTFIIGVIITIFYIFLIKSSIDKITLFLIFALSIANTCFNLYFVNNYKIIFQVAQNEYILNILTTIINLISQITAIFLIIKTKNIIYLRFNYFFYNVVLGLIIIYISKKKYKFVLLSNTYKPELIKGTNDIIVSKFTSVVYSSATILFLSTFVGTISTSIYATYNSIVNIVKNCLYSIVNAPQNAIGQILASEDNNIIKNIFDEYEYLVFLGLLYFLSITYILIIPFIKIYTAGISDVNYIDYKLAVLIVLIVASEIIHIPSGIIINMSGRFKVSRKIQTIACVLLLVCNFIGAYFFQLYGLLVATLLVNIFLASCEMCYVRIVILKSSLKRYYTIYLLMFFCTMGVSYLISNVLWTINMTFGSFIIYSALLAFIMLIYIVPISLLFNKKDSLKVFKRVFLLFFKNKVK